MPGGSAGSIYAEAKLDISQFESAANALGSSTQKIARDFDKAGASAERLQEAGSGILSLAEQAEYAAQAAGNLENALREAMSAGGDPTKILKLNAQYEKAYATAERLGELVYPDLAPDSINTGTDAMSEFGASALDASDDVSSLLNSLGGFESFANTVLMSASRSMGSFVARTAGLSSSSIGGILASRTAGVGLRTLAKSLGVARLGWIGLGAAAVYGGYRIVSAIDEARTANEQWQEAISSVNKEQTETFKATINAEVESNTQGFKTKVDAVWDEISKALTDGKPDTASVVKKLKTSVGTTFESIRRQVEIWYETEMSKLDLSTEEGQKAAEALTTQYESMATACENYTTQMNTAIDSIAGKSTAESEAKIAELESMAERIAAASDVIDKITALSTSESEAAYFSVSRGYTSDSRTVADAFNYLDDKTYLDYQYKLLDIENQRQDLLKNIEQAEIDGNAAAVESYRGQLDDLEELARAEGQIYETNRASQFADLMQTVISGMMQDNPALQNAYDEMLSGGAFNINDPALSQMISNWWESGLLSGITDVDIEGKEGKELGKAYAQILRDIMRYGDVSDENNPLGESLDALLNKRQVTDWFSNLYGFGKQAQINKNSVQDANQIADAIASVNAAVASGNASDLSKEASRLSALYSLLSEMDISDPDTFSFFSNIAEQLGASGVNGGNLLSYFSGLLGQSGIPVTVPIEMQPEIVGGTDPYDTMTSEEKEAINRMPEQKPIEVEQTIEPQPIVEDKLLKKSEYPSAEELFGDDVYSVWFGEQEPISIEVPVGMVPIVESLGGESADGPLVALVKQLETSEPQTIQIPVDVDVSDEMYSSGNDGGMQFGAGIVAGIQSKAGAVMDAARAIASAAAATIRDALKINSPSKVTTKYGEYFDLGFIRGIENEIPHIDSAIRDALDITPHSVLYRGSTFAGAAAGSGGSFQIDYDRLANAMNKRSIVMTMDGKKVAETNANNTAYAQNSRERRIQARYGSNG